MVIHVSDEDYEVGYGKPPEHTRFKPGKSGNPRGRKRSTPHHWEDPLQTVLQIKLPVNWDGKRVKVPAYKAVLMTTLRKALSGCTPSTKLLLEWTDGFKSLVADEKQRVTEAERAIFEELRRDADTWEA